MQAGSEFVIFLPQQPEYLGLHDTSPTLVYPWGPDDSQSALSIQNLNYLGKGT